MKKFLLTFILAVSALFTADAKVVLTEDFSLFTNGSDTAPDYNNMMTDLTGLTQTAGWSGMYVCQAGGSAYPCRCLSCYTGSRPFGQQRQFRCYIQSQIGQLPCNGYHVGYVHGIHGLCRDNKRVERIFYHT